MSLHALAGNPSDWRSLGASSNGSLYSSQAQIHGAALFLFGRGIVRAVAPTGKLRTAHLGGPPPCLVRAMHPAARAHAHVVATAKTSVCCGRKLAYSAPIS